MIRNSFIPMGVRYDSDALAQDPWRYYEILYTIIQKYTEFSMKSDSKNMLICVSELNDYTSYRFNDKEAKQIQDMIDKIRPSIYKSTPKTRGQQIIMQNENIKLSEEVRVIYRKLMKLMNHYNLLIDTYRKDRRLKSTM